MHTSINIRWSRFAVVMLLIVWCSGNARAQKRIATDIQINNLNFTTNNYFSATQGGQLIVHWYSGSQSYVICGDSTFHAKQPGDQVQDATSCDQDPGNQNGPTPIGLNIGKGEVVHFKYVKSHYEGNLLILDLGHKKTVTIDSSKVLLHSNPAINQVSVIGKEKVDL